MEEYLNVDGAMNASDIFQILAGSVLVKGQRLALLHERNVSQLDEHLILVIRHACIPAYIPLA